MAYFTKSWFVDGVYKDSKRLQSVDAPDRNVLLLKRREEVDEAEVIAVWKRKELNEGVEKAQTGREGVLNHLPSGRE